MEICKASIKPKFIEPFSLSRLLNILAIKPFSQHVDPIFVKIYNMKKYYFRSLMLVALGTNHNTVSL